MRQYRTSALIVGLVGVVLCFALALGRRPAEPSYQGKRLSEWLDERKPPGIILTDASIRAVREMRTNALPFLMSMLRSSDSQLKLRLAMRVQNVRIVRGLIPLNGERHNAAIRGFRALGLEAKPVFPEIVELILSSDDNSSAINALTEADAGTISELANGLAHPDRKVRCRAAHALGALRQAPAISVPALGRALKDSAPEVRAAVKGSLACYRADLAYVRRVNLNPKLRANAETLRELNPERLRATAEALRNTAADFDGQEQ